MSKNVTSTSKKAVSFDYLKGREAVKIYLDSSNLARKVCVSWALSLVECVAVWVLMLTHIQAPHTGVLKAHESQSLSGKLPEA